MGSVGDVLRSVVYGADDPRVRATWRVLLAMPLLWTLTGAVLTGNVQSAIGWIPSGPSQLSGLAASLLHAGFLLVALVPWARYLDCQPLSDYGIAASRGWVRGFLVGLFAVVMGHAVWVGGSSLAGGTTVRVAPSTPEGSLVHWFLLPVGALGLHAAVQQVVFFRVILGNAAEGLHARGITAGRAALVGIPVAAAAFIAMHGSATPLRVLDLAIVGVLFGLLFVHTGELAIGIGAHLGAFYSGTVVFAVLEQTGSLAGVLGTVDQYGFAKMVLAYCLVVGWLVWRRGDLPLQAAIAQWDGG